MFVDESVEGHPVSPAGGEVVDVNVWISGPEEETRTENKKILKTPFKNVHNHLFLHHITLIY